MPEPKFKIGDYVHFQMVSGKWTKNAHKIVEVNFQQNPEEYEVYYVLEGLERMSINENILRN